VTREATVAVGTHEAAPERLVRRLLPDGSVATPIISHVFHRNGGRPIKTMRQAFNAAAVRAGLKGHIPHDLRRLSRAHTAFPIRVGGEDTKVWFEWSARWEDIDQTGSIDWPYGKTPGIYDRTVSQEVSGWTGTDRQKLRIVAGAKGTLWLKAVAHFFVDVPGDKNQEYTQTAWVSCSVTIGRDGKIHFGTAAASVIPNLQEDALARDDQSDPQHGPR